LVKDKLKKDSIEQYQNEERSILVRRIAGFEERLNELLLAMKADELSPTINFERLKQETYQVTLDKNFKNATSMGEIVEAALNFIKRNYHSHGGDE